LQEHFNAILFLSSYIKMKDHFNSERLLDTQKKQQAIANARDLVDNAARVCALTDGAMFDLYSSKQEKGMIAASVSDAYLQRNASHQGFLVQANHIIHTGINYQQLMEFESAISTLEQENGGSMMTSDGINLSSSCASKQRARNTGPSGLLGASLLTAEIAAKATGDGSRGILDYSTVSRKKDKTLSKNRDSFLSPGMRESVQSLPNNWRHMIV
jgi:hypothetical protein